MANESAMDEAMKMVKEAIVSLNLSGVAASAVKIKETLLFPMDERQSGQDHIIIAPWGPEVDGGPAGRGNNLHDEWTYPVMVALCGNPDQTSLQRRLRIRRNLRRRFHRKTASDFSTQAAQITDGTLIQTLVAPGNIVDVQARMQDAVFVSPMIVNVTVQEVRSQ